MVSGWKWFLSNLCVFYRKYITLIKIISNHKTYEILYLKKIHITIIQTACIFKIKKNSCLPHQNFRNLAWEFINSLICYGLNVVVFLYVYSFIQSSYSRLDSYLSLIKQYIVHVSVERKCKHFYNKSNNQNVHLKCVII